MMVIVLLLEQTSLGLQKQGDDPSPLNHGAVFPQGFIMAAEVERGE